MTSFMQTIKSYLNVYKSAFIQFWHQMTPQQYASILIFVAVVGFLAMGSKRR